MTHEDIVYDRRVRLINYAAEIGNVTRACRVFGVSRKTYYQWLAKAEQYGLSALLPKERRTPHQPNAMSMEEVSVILAEAVARPTLGARSLLRHLHARGVHRSASGVAKVLHRHNLGTARLRVAALASLTAADSRAWLFRASLASARRRCRSAWIASARPSSTARGGT